MSRSNEIFALIESRRQFGRDKKRSISQWLSNHNQGTTADLKEAIESGLNSFKQSKGEEEAILDYHESKWDIYRGGDRNSPKWIKQWKGLQPSLGQVGEPRTNIKIPRISEISLQVDAIKQITQFSDNPELLIFLSKVISNEITSYDATASRREAQESQKLVGETVVEDKKPLPKWDALSQNLLELLKELAKGNRPNADLQNRLEKTSASFNTDFLISLQEFYDGDNHYYGSKLYEALHSPSVKGSSNTGWDLLLRYLESQGKRIPNRKSIRSLLDMATGQYKGRKIDRRGERPDIKLTPRPYIIRDYVLENDISNLDEETKNRYVEILNSNLFTLITKEKSDWKVALEPFWDENDNEYNTKNLNNSAKEESEQNNRDVDVIYARKVDNAYKNLRESFDKLEEYNKALGKLGVENIEHFVEVKETYDEIINAIEDMEDVQQRYETNEERRAKINIPKSKLKTTDKTTTTQSLMDYLTRSIEHYDKQIDKTEQVIDELEDKIESQTVSMGLNIDAEIMAQLTEMAGIDSGEKELKNNQRRISGKRKKLRILRDNFRSARQTLSDFLDNTETDESGNLRMLPTRASKIPVDIEKVKEKIMKLSSSMKEWEDKDLSEIKQLILDDINIRKETLQKLKDKSEDLDWEEKEDGLSYTQILSLLDRGTDDVNLGWIPSEIAGELKTFDDKIESLPIPKITIDGYYKDDDDKDSDVWTLQDLQDDILGLQTDVEAYRNHALNEAMSTYNRYNPDKLTDIYSTEKDEKGQLKIQITPDKKEWIDKNRTLLQKLKRKRQVLERKVNTNFKRKKSWQGHKKRILDDYIKNNPDQSRDLTTKAEDALRRIIRNYSRELDKLNRELYKPMLNSIKQLERMEVEE